jgi:uncharacterized membrane protein
MDSQTTDPEQPTGKPFAWPQVRRFGMDAPWRWLRAGWGDLRAAPAASLFYGAVLALMGFVLTRYADGAAGLAFVTGFFLVGPFLAVGIYELSRRRAAGESLRLAPTLAAWRTNFPAIGFYALILMLSLAIWIRVSVVVVALFFPQGVPEWSSILQQFARSPDPWVFATAYLAAGSGIALMVFATSAVSLPMLLDRREMDTVSAMIVSFNVLRANFRPMLLWGAIIVALTAAGFAGFYLGLVLALPLIGHASWHAYKEAVEDE